MKINKFLEFKENKLEKLFESLINESVVYYSPRFRKILNKLSKNDKIALSLLSSEKENIKDDITFIDLDDTKPGYITFAKMDKVKKNIDPNDYYHIINRLDDLDYSTLDLIYSKDIENIYSKNRNSLKLTKVINRISKEQFKPDEVDIFTRKVIAKLTALSNFKLIKGEEIGNWYNVSNYAETKGSLGGSCMREKKSSFFELYTQNEEVCSMLILLDDDDKLIGRALVWKLHDHDINDAPKELFFMDRQYVIDETDVQRFRNYANEQGWAYKTNNNHHSLEEVTYKDNSKSTQMEVKINVEDYDNYPYMDTFRKYDPNEGILYNNKDKENSDGFYILESTTGGYSEIRTGIYSSYEDEYIDEDYAIWSEVVDSYLHIDRASEVTSGSTRYRGWYPEGYDDLVYDEWLDEYIHINDSIWSEHYGYYILQDNACNSIVAINSDGMPTEESDIVCDDSAFYSLTKYKNTNWYKKLSEEYDDWKYIGKLHEDLTYINLNGDICLNEFKIGVFKVKEMSEKAIELGFKDILYLHKDDANLLDCVLEYQSYNYDMFDYFNDLKDILPNYYRFLLEKEEELNKELYSSDNDDRRNYLRKEISNLEKIKSNIESNKYVEIELE